MKTALALAIAGLLLVTATAMTAFAASKTHRVSINYVPPKNPAHEPIYEDLKERRVLEDALGDPPGLLAVALPAPAVVQVGRGVLEAQPQPRRFGVTRRERHQTALVERPVRERDPGDVLETLVAAVDKGGYDEAAVTSLSTADYSCVSPLIKKAMERLRPKKISLGVSSLRAYGLDEDLLDEIAEEENQLRQRGIEPVPVAVKINAGDKDDDENDDKRPGE